MPGNKKRDLITISARIRKDQKERIDAEREKKWGATQDGIIRKALDEYFKRKEERK